MAPQKIKTPAAGIKKNQPVKKGLNKVTPKKDNLDRYVIPGIVLITAFVFVRSLFNGFIENLDDNAYVMQNDLITYLNWSGIKAIFSTFFQGNYHPLTLLSFAIEYRFFRLNPLPYHLTNYILHLVNTMLVYLFIKRFSGKIWVAVICSLFFGIHPMHVESVAWITERKDVLYTFFFLLSLICYTKYLLHEKKTSLLVWSLIWFILSLLSKPAAVSLPLVLVLMDYYQRKLSKRTVIEKIPFFVLSLFFSILTVISASSNQSINNISGYYSIIDRFFMASYSIAYYLVKVIAPFNLSAMHYLPDITNNFLPFEYYLALPLLILIVWGTFRSGRFKRDIIFGLLFYFFTVLPMLQILAVGQAIVSERYAYVPYIGVFFIAGQFVSYARNNIIPNRISAIFSGRNAYAPCLIAFFLVLFSVLTVQRIGVWKNGETLFHDVLVKYPHNGYSWFALATSEDGRMEYDTAVMYYSKAIELSYNEPSAYYNRGNSEDNIKQYDAAINDYDKVLQLNPDFVQAYLNRGNCEKDKKEFNLAISDYDKALSMGMNSAYYNRGLAEAEEKNYASAMADYTKAIEYNPGYAGAYFNRGNIKNEMNEPDSAILDFSMAIEANPQFAEAYLNRGATENQIKDLDDAEKDFSKVIELSPNNVSAYLNRGIVKSEKKEYAIAIDDYNEAIELSPNYASVYFNRGLAKYYLNDKNGACTDWQTAIQLGNMQAAVAINQYCK